MAQSLTVNALSLNYACFKMNNTALRTSLVCSFWGVLPKLLSKTLEFNSKWRSAPLWCQDWKSYKRTAVPRWDHAWNCFRQTHRTWDPNQLCSPTDWWNTHTDSHNLWALQFIATPKNNLILFKPILLKIHWKPSYQFRNSFDHPWPLVLEICHTHAPLLRRSYGLQQNDCQKSYSKWQFKVEAWWGGTLRTSSVFTKNSIQ